MLKPDNMVASTEPIQAPIGYLFWSSIGSLSINRDNLKEKLINSGVGENWMPPSIRSVDAFRRATREVQRKKPTSNPKIFENYLVREVFSDKKTVQRNIVVEHVNQNDKELGYETEVAIIQLDKTHNTIYFQAETPEVKELCEEARSKYNQYKNYYNSQHIRVLVSKILDSLAPTPMRENGIIYFVPYSMRDGITNLVNFINSLNNCTAHKIDLVDSTDHRNMVNQHLNSHLDGLLKTCKNAEGLRNDQIKEIIKQTNNAIRDFNEYRALVDSEKIYYRKKIELLRQEVERLVIDFGN